MYEVGIDIVRVIGAAIPLEQSSMFAVARVCDRLEEMIVARDASDVLRRPPSGAVNEARIPKVRVCLPSFFDPRSTASRRRNHRYKSKRRTPVATSGASFIDFARRILRPNSPPGAGTP